MNEADRVNVSLTCEVDAGNPATLSAVRWYLDGDLLKELPDCPRNSTAMTASTEESSTFCDIDPSKLLLESVGRSFHGNYSCEGRNEAGWGPTSPSTPVIVYCKSSLSHVTHSRYAVMEKLAIRNTHYVFDHNSLRPSYSCFEIHAHSNISTSCTDYSEYMYFTFIINKNFLNITYCIVYCNCKLLCNIPS